MLTCVFTLTACGADDTVSEIQQSKLDAAELRAQYTVGAFKSIVDDDIADAWLDNYNNVELSEMFSQGMEGILAQVAGSDLDYGTEGTAVRGALTSFKDGIEEMGGDFEIGETSSKVDDDTIVVTVGVTGTEKNGEVELIFSNDIFFTLESCTLNVDETFASLMEGAALNTLLGMGTVFVVLILISLIISLLGYIPKLIAKPEKKDESAANIPAPVTAAMPVQEEELSDDEELVAVIAAAVAAYEGTGTDGFRVRSIKRANTKNWYK